MKVGDNVKIKSWNDMIAEFGINANGYVRTYFGFGENMKHLCGKTGVISFIDGKYINIDFDDSSDIYTDENIEEGGGDAWYWYFDDNMFELV